MAFNDALVQKVWEKGNVVPNNDQNVWRKDNFGAWINRKSYGDRDSQYGWQIDHVTPDGPDNLSNLRPLQWQNNLDKSDGRLQCNITANGTSNGPRR